MSTPESRRSRTEGETIRPVFSKSAIARNAARRSTIATAVAGALLVTESTAELKYWRTDGTAGESWNSLSWSAGAPSLSGGTGWTSGDDAVFTSDSSLSYVSQTPFRNVTLADGITVTIAAAGTASAAAHVYDIGAGSALNWSSQNFTAAGTSFVKGGSGIWDIGAISNAYSGGFTLNAGTVIVSGNNSFGTGTLTINGGTIQSSGTRTFATSSIVIGGDFTLTGSGNSAWSGNMTLGQETRTITNSAVGSGVSRTFGGIVSGDENAGLIVSGAGTGTVASGTTTTILSGANTYSGGTTLNNGGILQLVGSGTLGSTSGSLTVNAGRLDLNGTSQTVGNLDGIGGTIVNNATGSTATLTIGNGNGTGGNYQGVIADNTSGTGRIELYKTGNGTLTLSGANTYSGGTVISEGSLVAANVSAFGSGAVNLASGELGSSVSNLAIATLSLEGGRLDLNGTNGGTVTVSGVGAAFTMSAGIWSLNLAENSDRIISSSGGSFAIGGGTFDLGGGSIDYGATYSLLSGFGSGSISNLSFTNFNSNAYHPSLSQTGTLSFSAIPEPDSALAGLLIGAGLIRRKRPA